MDSEKQVKGEAKALTNWKEKGAVLAREIADGPDRPKAAGH